MGCLCVEESVAHDVPFAWLESVACVFEADMSCCRRRHPGGAICDRKSLVPPLLALYFDLYVNSLGRNEATNTVQSAFQTMQQVVLTKKDQVFPATYKYEGFDGRVERHRLFGSLISTVEEYVERDPESAEGCLRSACLQGLPCKSDLFEDGPAPAEANLNLQIQPDVSSI